MGKALSYLPLDRPEDKRGCSSSNPACFSAACFAFTAASNTLSQARFGLRSRACPSSPRLQALPFSASAAVIQRRVRLAQLSLGVARAHDEEEGAEDQEEEEGASRQRRWALLLLQQQHKHINNRKCVALLPSSQSLHFAGMW